MSEYYAVQRSGEYLEHYGVKGMKWGVRKAKAMWTSGNRSRAAKKLLRQYKKASKKLNKLNDKADLSKQKTKQIKYAKRAGVGIGIGMLGTAGTVGGAHVRNKLLNRYNTNYKQASALNNQLDAIRKLRGAAGIATLGGYAYSGYAGARSMAAARRQTPKGHTKAVAKRDAWQKEMKSAFKGTKYQNLPKVKTRREEKADKYKKRSDTWRSTEKEMRYWAERTPRPGEARSNYLNIAKRASKKAKRYERKYARIRRKSK